MSWFGADNGVDAAWLGVGFLGQAAFTSRFLVQWVASERRRDSVVPTAFWWFSLVGGLTLLSYAVYRLKDPVIIVGQCAGVFIYTRNLYLISTGRRRERAAADGRRGHAAPAASAPTPAEAAAGPQRASAAAGLQMARRRRPRLIGRRLDGEPASTLHGFVGQGSAAGRRLRGHRPRSTSASAGFASGFGLRLLASASAWIWARASARGWKASEAEFMQKRRPVGGPGRR